ncbi:hypothetical protein D3C72_1016180 [compost metagenome]
MVGAVVILDHHLALAMGIDARRHHAKDGVGHLVVQAAIRHHVHAVRRAALCIRHVRVVHEDFHAAHARHAVAHVGRDAGQRRRAQTEQPGRIARPQLGRVFRHASRHARLQVADGVPPIDLRDDAVQVAHGGPFVGSAYRCHQAGRAQKNQGQAGGPGKRRCLPSVGVQSNGDAVAGHCKPAGSQRRHQARQHLRQVRRGAAGVGVDHAVNRYGVCRLRSDRRLQGHVRRRAGQDLHGAVQCPQVLADAMPHLRTRRHRCAGRTVQHHIGPRRLVAVARYAGERHGAVQRYARRRARVHRVIHAFGLLPQRDFAFREGVDQQAGNTVRAGFHRAIESGGLHARAQVRHDLLADFGQARAYEPVRCDTVGHRYLNKRKGKEGLRRA